MKKELANCFLNASETVVKAGEDTIKNMLLNDILPEFASRNHKTRSIHIHDLEFYGISHNCIGIRVKDLIGDNKYPFLKALRELGRKIIWLTNLQSGGIGFLDFDTDMKIYLGSIDEEEAIEGLREFFCDLNVFSRKGCEKPYVTFNFGLDTTKEGRRFTSLLLASYLKGNEQGNPFIFPNLVFKLKKEINVSEVSPNYDLFLSALSVTSRRMIPTYFNCDTPGNISADSHNIGIMGCRTRVISNLYGEDSGLNRGNIACVTINLVQIAFNSMGHLDIFKNILREKMEESKKLLLHRLYYLAEKGDFSELKGSKIYKDSEKSTFEMLRNGTLSIGFIGLWDALSVLYNSEFSSIDDMVPYRSKALDIVSFMQSMVEKYKQENKLNFSLLASAAEGVSGTFAEYDAKHLGKTSSVCRKGYYTNSFHVPVYIDCDYTQKINFEAPFHKMCNGGCITYVEMEEMPGSNVEATEEVILYAYNSGCNYMGINFPLDNCNDCGFIGRISHKCPKCSSSNIKKLRRVSGYLAEEHRFTLGKEKEMRLRRANVYTD